LLCLQKTIDKVSLSTYIVDRHNKGANMKEVEVRCSSKKAVVDDEDFDRVSKYKWSYMKEKRTGFEFIFTRVWSDKEERYILHYLHRVIARVRRKSGKGVGFRNDNIFDCRKANLISGNINHIRLLDVKHSNNTSGYRGVSKIGWTVKPRWRSQLIYKGTHHDLGSYATPEDAALAYNEAAKKYFGDLAYQNVIKKNGAAAKKKIKRQRA